LTLEELDHSANIYQTKYQSALSTSSEGFSSLSISNGKKLSRTELSYFSILLY